MAGSCAVVHCERRCKKKNLVEHRPAGISQKQWPWRQWKQIYSRWGIESNYVGLLLTESCFVSSMYRFQANAKWQCQWGKWFKGFFTNWLILYSSQTHALCILSSFTSIPGSEDYLIFILCAEMKDKSVIQRDITCWFSYPHITLRTDDISRTETWIKQVWSPIQLWSGVM